MQEEGFVAKLLFPEGTSDVPLGVPIAILVENKKDIAAFADYVYGATPDAPSESAQPVAASSSAPSHQ
jgi:pyruvate dehydrogenase E2 component (dihydrolipoamide acetyltransferase)